jgi:two-component system response regulator AtoC
MDSQEFKILIVDDEPPIANYLAGLLPRARFQSYLAHSGKDCLRIAQMYAPYLHMVLIDADMPDMDGFETVEQLSRISAKVPVVMMGHFSDPSHVVKAMQCGAQGILQKPVLQPDLEKLVERFCRKPKVVAIDAQPYVEDFGDGQFFLAVAPAMRAIQRQAILLSRADVPVLITGESGAGKEVIAQLLHKNSLRAGRQFLKINCAALPADLLESELFGYEAGAFTGAMKSKPGKFELCDRGTILLDEIGEMSPQLQAKLLQVLQDGTFSRLGGRVNTKVNVRVIAATNVNIEQAIAEKRFREDLYYRLNAFVIHVPSLRERREEIPYFLDELSTRFARMNNLEQVAFSPEMIAAALQYSWPGNLRELGNFVKRYLITRDAESALVELESKIGPHKKPVTSSIEAEEAAASAGSGLKSVVRSMKDQTESRMILEVLGYTKWNRRIAAEQLQISYKALLYKIRLYNLKASA